MGNDAIDEENQILCCAFGCVNVSIYNDCNCYGCSGKGGICCCNFECCCKPSAPCLFPCCCVGIKPECDGCSVVNAQCHACCLVGNAAFPCNEEVPVALAILGFMVYPKCGCCVMQSEIMDR